MKYILIIALVAVLIFFFTKLRIRKKYAKCHGICKHRVSGKGKTWITFSRSINGGYSGDISSTPGWDDEYDEEVFDIGNDTLMTFKYDFTHASKGTYGVLKWNNYSHGFKPLKDQSKGERLLKRQGFINRICDCLVWLFFDALIILFSSPLFSDNSWLIILGGLSFVLIPTRSINILFKNKFEWKSIIFLDVFMLIDIASCIVNPIFFNTGDDTIGIIAISFFVTAIIELIFVVLYLIYKSTNCAISFFDYLIKK